MGDYFRERTRLWAVAGVMVGAMVTAWDLAVVAPGFLAAYAVRNDFRLAYAAADLGLREGYGRLYDLSAQRVETPRLSGGSNVHPSTPPPPLAWLVPPLTALPFLAALVIWTALLIGALLWTWYLLAPGEGLVKAAHLLLWLGVFPVAFGVMVCPPGALVVAAVASAGWVGRGGRRAAA